MTYRKFNIIISSLVLMTLFALAPFCSVMAMNKYALRVTDSSTNLIMEACSQIPVQADFSLKKSHTNSTMPNCCLNKSNLSDIIQAETRVGVHSSLVLILPTNVNTYTNGNNTFSNVFLNLPPPTRGISLLTVSKKE